MLRGIASRFYFNDGDCRWAIAMCKHGCEVFLSLVIPAHLSHTGKSHLKLVAIDECIAPIVKALNAGGVPTEGSCCGHGEQLGSIILSDGRELIIAPDSKTARNIEKFGMQEAHNGG